jgi:hypothetical protein
MRDATPRPDSDGAQSYSFFALHTKAKLSLLFDAKCCLPPLAGWTLIAHLRRTTQHSLTRALDPCTPNHHRGDMATARCYTCHTLRPLADFSYRGKDSTISAASRLRRYVCVLLHHPDARPRNGGAIYRYRCVHPRAGECPKAITAPRPPDPAPQLHVREEWLAPEVEVDHVVEIEVEALDDQDDEFRRAKEEAVKTLRECVETAERAAISP